MYKYTYMGAHIYRKNEREREITERAEGWGGEREVEVLVLEFEFEVGEVGRAKGTSSGEKMKRGYMI